MPPERKRDPQSEAAKAELAAKLKQFRATKDWTNVLAVYEKLLDLEPKNYELRRFVAWDLAYNVAVEPAEVDKRYEWVRRAVLLLVEGLEEKNQEAQLCWDAGWFIGFRIGRGDDRRGFRAMFAGDNELHRRIGRDVPVGQALGPDGKPDNWLVARLFFLRAIDLVEPGEEIGNLSPLLYRCEPAQCRTRFAEALVHEGHFDETAVRAWREAESEWRQVGDCPFATSYGTTVRFNDRPTYVAQATHLWKEFDRLQPGLRKRLRDEAAKGLSEAQRRALDTPDDKRTVQEDELAYAARRRLRLSRETLSAGVAGPDRVQALRLAEEALAADRQAELAQRYAEIVNFHYWLRRCRIEQSEVVRQARHLVFRAKEQLSNGRLGSDDPQNPGARQLFDQGFRRWADAFAQFDDLIEDEYVCQELVASVGQYRQAILKGRALPQDFPLRSVIDKWGHAQVETKR